MKTFVINLKRSTQRRDYIENHLKGLGLKYEILDATDGKQLNREVIAKIHNQPLSQKLLKHSLTLGEIACAHSHIRIYERIVREKIPYTLIVEDDAVIDKKLLPFLCEEFLKQSDFDWLQINYPPLGLAFIKNWLTASRIRIKQKPSYLIMVILKFPGIIILSLIDEVRSRFYAKQPRICTVLRPLYTTGCYIITLAGAKKLLDFGNPIIYAADMLPNRARLKVSFKMKAVFPLLVNQKEDFSSDIGAR